MGFSFFGLLILVVIGLVVVGGVATLFGSRKGSSGTLPPAAGMTLNCPHCGQVTDATRTKCASCGADL